MPPCGYNNDAIEHILMHLEEIYEDLMMEVSRGKYKDIKSGIEEEIVLLEKSASNTKLPIFDNQFTLSVLHLAKVFYVDLLKSSSVDMLINQYREILKALHINKKGFLVKNKLLTK